jgi:uncharacterized protein YuzE
LRPVRIEYDAGADTAYFYLREVAGDEWKHTHVALPDVINLDFDEHQRLVRIEVRTASQRLPHSFLASAKWLR